MQGCSYHLCFRVRVRHAVSAGFSHAHSLKYKALSVKPRHIKELESIRYQTLQTLRFLLNIKKLVLRGKFWFMRNRSLCICRGFATSFFIICNICCENPAKTDLQLSIFKPSFLAPRSTYTNKIAYIYG
jgi:hypothetical protein